MSQPILFLILLKAKGHVKYLYFLHLVDIGHLLVSDTMMYLSLFNLSVTLDINSLLLYYNCRTFFIK